MLPLPQPAGFSRSRSRLQRSQQAVAQTFMAERSRQMARAASGSIFGHVRSEGPTLSESKYGSGSFPDLHGLSAGAFGKPPMEQQHADLPRLGLVQTPQRLVSPAGTMGDRGSFFAPLKPAGKQPTTIPQLHGSARSPKAPGGGAVAKPPEIDLLLDGIRARFRDRGVTSMKQITDAFTEMDKDRDGRVSLDEFRDYLLIRGILRSDPECRAMFNYFDSDDSGFIDCGEFTYLVRGSLSERRRQVVHEAFKSLDRTGDGVITVEDLVQAFDAANSLDVMAGAKSVEDAMQEFLDMFDTVNRDGRVTLPEFERYYEDVGALITSDDYFVMMVQNAWHLDGALGGHCLRVKITDNNGFGRVIEVRDDVGINRQSPEFPALLRRILAEKYGVNDIAWFEVLGRY